MEIPDEMLLKSYFLTVLLVLSWKHSSQLKLNQCEASLGMQSLEIKDESLSSSSNLNETALSPASARIRLEVGGGAWCPKNQVTSDGEEYLQVDLGELHIVTMVETQGRFGNGQGQEFTERYRLEFQRERDGKWFRYRNIGGDEILKGNVNTYIAEMREVRPVIIASKVRFIPYSDHPTKVCLRVELYGCLWRESVVSYSIPQGEKRGTELDFSDFMYDGVTTNIRGTQWLVGGLGQLMDRIEGQDNFRLDLNKIGRRGHEWVGWKNDSFPQGSVEMRFAFDSLRNFSSLSIFCNNMFTREVRCFSRAQVVFSESELPESDPTKFPTNGKGLAAVEFNSPRMEEMEMAKNVTIPLRNHVGRHVKVVLFFSSKWILISEVYFSSVPAAIPSPPLLPHFNHEESSPIPEVPGSKGHDHLQQPTQSNIASDARLLPTTSPNNSLNWSSNKAGRGDNDKTEMLPSRSSMRGWNIFAKNLFHSSPQNICFSPGVGERLKTNDAFYEMSSDQKAEFDMMVILLSIFGLLLAIFVVFFLLFCMFKRGKYCCHSTDHCFLDHSHHHRSHPSKAPSILMNSTGPTNSFFLPLSKSDTSSATFRQSYSFPAAVNGEDQNSGSTVVDPLVFSPFNISPSAVEETIYRPPSSAVSFPLTFLESLPVCGRIRTSNCSNGGFSTSTQPLLPPVYSASSTGFHYTTISGNSTCPPTSLAGSSSSGVTQQSSIPSEVNRDCLKYVATIGDGKFGQVYLCEMQPCSSFSHYSTLSSISSWKAHINPALVAVKVLLAHTDQTSRAKFENELHIMSRVRDSNIANLVGVCTRDLPNCLVFEYLRYGDLKKFLQKRCSQQQLLSRTASTPSPTAHRPHSAQEVSTGNKSESLSTGCLLYMSSQIASGMRHLESLGLVHRDLACRNCLVGDNFNVKVSDLGTSHLSYEADYFSLPSSDLLLPIRWMAWEAVLLGKHTTKSDVWSFGMTLWEMMNFAHKSPFSDFTEEQVLQNCENFRFKSGSETLPPKPHGCSRELYDLMLHCWSREKDDRPPFHEITMFLHQKTSGFNPQDDRHWLDDDNLISE